MSRTPLLMLFAFILPTPLYAAGCEGVSLRMQEYLFDKNAIMQSYYSALHDGDTDTAKRMGDKLKHYTFTQVALVKDYQRLQRKGCDFSRLCNGTRQSCGAS